MPRIGHRHQLRALDLAVDELDVLQGRVLVPNDAERRRLDLAQAVVEDRTPVEGLERQGVAVGRQRLEHLDDALNRLRAPGGPPGEAVNLLDRVPGHRFHTLAEGQLPHPGRPPPGCFPGAVALPPNRSR